MHHHNPTPDPELDLALLHRAILARSLDLRAHARTSPPDLSASLRSLSQLGAAAARHRPAAPSDQLPDFLLEAASRVRESAAAGEPLPWEKPNP